jgi:hypothetical protein
MKNPNKTPQKRVRIAKNKEENSPNPESNENPQQSPSLAKKKSNNLPPVARVLANLFKSIAVEESEVSSIKFEH